uniref:Uncharacterized protein n=1 Tax=Panagrolaimus sp. ES5 TaxID=591445 RepID=A0AC34FKR8_9BILA
MTFATAFKTYLSNFEITDPTDFEGYRTTVEKIIEDEGWKGSEKICHLVNALNENLKPIEDCIDTIFATSALNLDPNNSAIIHYFSNIKQWEYACNEGKDRDGMKQEFLCVLQYYHENCGNDAALVLCSMQAVSYYGQNCLSRLDCDKEIITPSLATIEIVGSVGNSGNSTSENIFWHLKYVAAFWFTCRFV